MKAISIRQPWAWLIIRPDLLPGSPERDAWEASSQRKDVENRTWTSNYVGRLLVHAAKGMTVAEYEEARAFAERLGVEVPPPGELRYGGVIGAVSITCCTAHSDSPWFTGPWGFGLLGPEPLSFQPCRGQLGIFDLPEGGGQP